MYTLRTVFKDGTEGNTSLGNHYNFISKLNAPQNYSETSENVFKGQEPEKCYAFIVTEGGKEILPLYKGHYYFIMTDSGKTFSNLTFK